MSPLAFPLNLEDAGPGEAPGPVLAPVPEAAPADDATAGGGSLVKLEGGSQMTWRDQVQATAGHAWRLARRRLSDLSEREGGVVHAAVSGKIPSLAEQHLYAKGRAWVPPGHDGGVLEGMGVIYHWLAGRPGVAAAGAWGWLCARPFRAVAAVLIAAAIATAALWAVRDVMAAVLLAVCLAAAGALWAGAGALLMRLTNPRRHHVTDTDTDMEEGD